MSVYLSPPCLDKFDANLFEQLRAVYEMGIRMHFSRYISLSLVAAALSFGAIRSDQSGEPLPDLLIGYTEFRTDQPGGRYPNEWTMRSVIVKADGTGRRSARRGVNARKGVVDAVRRLVAGPEIGQAEPELDE